MSTLLLNGQENEYRNIHSRLPPTSRDLGFFNLEAPPRLEVSIESRIRIATMFSELQFQAYKDRLQIQPNGIQASKKLKKIEDTPKNKLLRLSIGFSLLDNLGKMGRDVITLLRAFGHEMQRSDTQEFKLHSQTGFREKLITGLSDSSGNSFAMSPDILLTLATTIHRSWRDSVSQSGFESHVPTTSSLITGDKRLFMDLPEHDPSTINYDSLTALFLCRRLAALSESEFQDILNLAEPGNPYNLNLSFAHGTDGSSILRDLDPDSFTSSPKGTVSRLALPLPSERVRIEARIQDGLSRLEEKLKSSELALLTPAILSRIEKGLNESEFFDLCCKLSDIKESRKYLLLAISLASRNVFATETNQNFDKDLIENLKSCSNREVYELFQGYEKEYHEKIENLTRGHQVNSSLSIVTDSETFAEHMQTIRALIESVKLDHKDPDFRKKGGILYDTYDNTFWKNLFEGGGSVFISKKDEQIKGFLILMPQEHPTDAYAELAVTARDRPKGTLDNLMKSMIARLQLGDALNITFVVYDFNLRSLAVQNRIGFFPQPILAYEIDMPDGRSASLVPYTLPLEAKNLKKLRELQSKLNS